MDVLQDVREREREIERVCVSVKVRVRARERERGRGRERERESVCVCVSERDRTRARQRESERVCVSPLSGASFVDCLSMRCTVGDIRLWVGDPSTFSCHVSLPRFSQPTLSLSSRQPQVVHDIRVWGQVFRVDYSGFSI